MNVTEKDGTTTRLEGDDALAAFRASKEPCTLNVPRSTRQRFVQRHRGEGIAAMIERLQYGRRWI